MNPRGPLAPLRFFGLSLLCQGVGIGAALLSHRIMIAIPIALALAFLFKLPVPWKWFNLLFVPLTILFLQLQLPTWVVAVTFIFLVLIYLPTFWTEVPYYPTSQLMYRAVLNELPPNQAYQFIDLGCGYGNLLFFLAKQNPKATYHGVEISFLPFIIGKLRSLFYANVHIRAQSFWQFSLAEYNYIYAFLAPGPMPRLWEKAKAEMNPQALLMINSFAVPATPIKTIPVADQRKCVLYLYQPSC